MATRYVGLFCAYTGFFGEYIGLFCGYIRLFCGKGARTRTISTLGYTLCRAFWCIYRTFLWIFRALLQERTRSISHTCLLLIEGHAGTYSCLAHTHILLDLKGHIGCKGTCKGLYVPPRTHTYIISVRGSCMYPLAHTHILLDVKGSFAGEDMNHLRSWLHAM